MGGGGTENLIACDLKRDGDVLRFVAARGWNVDGI